MKITDETYFKTNNKQRKKYSEWLKGLYDEIQEITEKENSDGLEQFNDIYNEDSKSKKYRKKPIIVEAYQTDKELEIETLEGVMKASPGDFIITGVDGEKYPCKPDIFQRTYEKVE